MVSPQQPRSLPAVAMPPVTTTEQGRERLVGIEIEFGGLELARATEVVAEFTSGTIQQPGRYERQVITPEGREWVIEVDFAYLKKLGRRNYDRTTFEGELSSSAEESLARLAETVVPVEIVSPPLPLSELPEQESLLDLLRQAGARGTSDSFRYAFGMQFNPEAPALDSQTINRYLKSFLCLYDALVKRADINFSRRLTNFIDPFPKDYVRKVISPTYWPGLTTLIRDYLHWNPTRNRALDMLPLFCHLDEPQVRQKVADELVKARPTFHYRLPDCELHLPEWGLSVPWNDWVQVEQLAYDNSRLDACCRAYQQFLDKPLSSWRLDWEQELEQQWLDH